VLEIISKLKIKNSKNHFSILVVYLPAYSYTGIYVLNFSHYFKSSHKCM